MVHRSQLHLLGVVLLIVVAWSCNRSEQPTAHLPDPPEGWTTGPSSEFVGDELFVWINGGAEIYHEYGFVSVTVQEYERGEERYSVEVYTMAEDAFGIYSWARSSTGDPVDMGAGGTVAEYYLHFWSGPRLVVVTAQNPGPDPRTAVLDLGRQIATDFPQVGEAPLLVDLIPTEMCPGEPVTFFVGPIAFNNLARRLAPYFSGFEDGVIASCQTADGDTEHLMFLRWVDPWHAINALENGVDRVAASEGLRFDAMNDESFTLHYDTGEVAAGLRKDHIIRVTMADGHRPKLDELPFWCPETRRQE